MAISTESNNPSKTAAAVINIGQIVTIMDSPRSQSLNRRFSVTNTYRHGWSNRVAQRPASFSADAHFVVSRVLGTARV